MGMGEPLANYASVLTAVRRMTDPVPDGLGISQRSVTVSTVGLVPAIRRLAAEGLHGAGWRCRCTRPTTSCGTSSCPVNRRWKVAEVLEAAWAYAAATGRRVSIEYALIRDVNDQPWRADALAALLAGHLAHVNLIPLNPTPGSRWTASEPGVMRNSRPGWPPGACRSPSATPGAARSTAPAASSRRQPWRRAAGWGTAVAAGQRPGT